jgi:hypothetical protein
MFLSKALNKGRFGPVHLTVGIYRLNPSLLAMVRRSRNGAVCYTCGKPLKLSDIVVSKFSRASHRSFRHAKCAVIKSIVVESDIKREVGRQSPS